MKNIQRSTIVKALLWFFWFLFTAFYIYPKYLAKGIYDMTGTFTDWISQHYEGLIFGLWFVMTLALFFGTLIKVSKDEDAKRERELPQREKPREDI